jgi:rhodanese-related sulfurtransferase
MARTQASITRRRGPAIDKSHNLHDIKNPVINTKETPMSRPKPAPGHHELDALELHAMLAAGTATLVDVREPDEFAAGHIAGAVNLPLSSFDPAAVPHTPGKRTVLNCAGGKRSGMALDRCVASAMPTDTHLAGGLAAWKAAGLPVVR